MYRTPKNQRAIYVYKFKNGEEVTLRPGEDGVTEADIAALHRADDDENNNDRQQHRSGRKTVTEIVSLDGSGAACVACGNNEFEPVLMRETINAALPEKQAKAVTAIWLDGMTVGEYAKMTGTADSTVSITVRRGINNLKKIMEK